MARGATRGAIPDSCLDQWLPVLVLSATFQGVRSAPTDTVGDATDGCRSMRNNARRLGPRCRFLMRFWEAAPAGARFTTSTTHHPLSTASAQTPHGEPEQRSQPTSGGESERYGYILSASLLSGLCTLPI